MVIKNKSLQYIAFAIRYHLQKYLKIATVLTFKRMLKKGHYLSSLIQYNVVAYIEQFLLALDPFSVSRERFLLIFRRIDKLHDGDG